VWALFYSIELMISWFLIKRLGYDEIARDEDPDYVRKVFEEWFKGLFWAWKFNGKRITRFWFRGSTSTMAGAPVFPNNEIIGVERKAIVIARPGSSSNIVLRMSIFFTIRMKYQRIYLKLTWLWWVLFTNIFCKRTAKKYYVATLVFTFCDDSFYS